MNRFNLFLFLPVLVLLYGGTVQNKTHKRGDTRIMFYNVENLFDTIDDPFTDDNQFLPDSKYCWSKSRYYKKLKKIYQVIAAVGEERPPEIIGFAEVENRKVLNDLIFYTPLEKFPYKVIHKDSPDQRGIDVALLYRSDKVKYISSDFITIHFPENKNKKTRDILYFKALIDKDTLHIFINHWPSRRGGKQKSESSRIFVAGVLKHKTDSLFKLNPNAKIVITGDFNDEPQDKSLSAKLVAKKYSGIELPATLYNLSWNMKNNCKCGTYRLANSWEMLDQFIVSGPLLAERKIFTCQECCHIGEFKFLLNDDNKYGGFRPNRTYLGPAYKGGYSDHLPVYLDVYQGN